MAGGDNGSSSRASSGYLSEEESADYGLIFNHFRENKVEIASAITKPFPFLMSLRDRGYISEQKFQNSQQSCENLIPPERVVYDILSDLQNEFSLSLLKVIFSATHLKAYPDLKETLRNFPDGSNNHRINGRDADERPRLLGGVTEASCIPGSSQMNDEQTEEVPSLPQCNGEGSSSCERIFDEQEPQDDTPSSPPRPEAECLAESFMKQKPRRIISPLGAEQSTSENEMCSCVMCSPAFVPENPEARMGSSRTDTMETGNNPTVRKSRGKRRKKKGHNWSRVKRRRPQAVRPKNGRRVGRQAAFRRKKTEKNPGRSAKTRVPRRRRNENADFSAELLPVTCGDVKGTLHKDRFKQGISMKSIQSEAGNWYTPTEFEILGGHGRSKNWKLSVRCYNWPLKLLIQRKFLPNLPRIYGKRKKRRTQDLSSAPANAQNSDECEVCRDGGMLFCCDTCPRAFHEECHIPAVEVEMTPWSCIFCRMQSLGSKQTHLESEVLQRQMVPQEQLKCEFVLLRIYCCSESSFFAKMPYYCYFRETSVGITEPMWLDLIKKKLKGRDYSHVKEFVQDVRLFFQNHKVTFKDRNFGQMGLRLESEFEKNFKEVFAIQDTNENS
uniref:nuclear body protein SP140-like protein isoform X3 n=1 Tax=Myodes glareolus TaxID=447135 RepID=UPI00202246DD|nr:nuclear body protein SP140-like protein isoform X3 [Myodes glareolus]